MQKHAGIIQKHLDEILERKCKAEDVDTKPGMMRILKKRVNEVEKEIAKENRKETKEHLNTRARMASKDRKQLQDIRRGWTEEEYNRRTDEGKRQIWQWLESSWQAWLELTRSTTQ